MDYIPLGHGILFSLKTKEHLRRSKQLPKIVTAHKLLSINAVEIFSSSDEFLKELYIIVN